MSLLCAEGPDLITTFDSAGIRMLWHPGLSEETGSEALAVFERVRSGALRLDALCVEGSLLRGPNGTGRFHVLAGTGRPTIEWVRELSGLAEHVVAVGTCAAYGGVTAAGTNPADACGLQYDGRREGGALGAQFRSRSGLPVINVAGCPTHPNWVTETLMLLAAGLLGAQDLDAYRRPRFYADHLVHHGCPRNEYYEFKASAEKLSDLGCMMEHLGCLGTQAHADCNTRSWNGEGSCTRGGYACINCTAPEFEEPGHAFLETPKVAGIPVGLPTDMPKAWFIALSSLAKAATPERLRRNAVSDHLVVPPTVRDIKRR
ncbi:MAG: HupU protein [Rhizobiales bacterium 24-66-13]|nr:MAG: HupU protein [Rhizobiales bacterium 35-66-30]OYZ67799.1 MAG: HupU protein [Rhizobiales bacterium 24-66-13]OZB07490.1 MAG: HupU protein [Rhizobiales bacterium 39-66-18]